MVITRQGALQLLSKTLENLFFFFLKMVMVAATLGLRYLSTLANLAKLGTFSPF